MTADGEIAEDSDVRAVQEMIGVAYGFSNLLAGSGFGGWKGRIATVNTGK
jgi:hypothetical protein